MVRRRPSGPSWSERVERRCGCRCPHTVAASAGRMEGCPPSQGKPIQRSAGKRNDWPFQSMGRVLQPGWARFRAKRWAACIFGAQRPRRLRSAVTMRPNSLVVPGEPGWAAGRSRAGSGGEPVPSITSGDQCRRYGSIPARLAQRPPRTDALRPLRPVSIAIGEPAMP